MKWCVLVYRLYTQHVHQSRMILILYQRLWGPVSNTIRCVYALREGLGFSENAERCTSRDNWDCLDEHVEILKAKLGRTVGSVVVGMWSVLTQCVWWAWRSSQVVSENNTRLPNDGTALKHKQQGERSRKGQLVVLAFSISGDAHRLSRPRSEYRNKRELRNYCGFHQHFESSQEKAIPGHPCSSA